MSSRLMFVGVITLLVVSLCWTVCAQTFKLNNKDCLLPEPVGHQAAPPSHHPLKGAALISILIDEKGRVLDPRIEQSSGSDDYDRDALNAVRSWRFTPSTCQGKPIKVRLDITMRPSPTQ